MTYPWIGSAPWVETDPWPGPDGSGSPADAVALTDAKTWRLDAHSAWSANATATTSSGGSLSASKADAEGLTDSARIATTRPKADPLGLHDAVTAVRTLRRSPADTAGLADTVSIVKSLHRSPADPLGLHDAGFGDTGSGDITLLDGEATVATQALASSAVHAQPSGISQVAYPAGTATVAAASVTAALLPEGTSAALRAQDLATSALVDATGTAFIYSQ